MSAVLSAPTKHSAPGQYLGFALQPVRLFYHLLSCQQAASVSLEHLDDVAVHYLDGSVLVEQTKSALSYNPLSNWSEDLWKAIANWLDAVRDGKLDIQKTRFCLYVTPSKKRGKWSEMLNKAESPKQVADLTKDIRKQLAAKEKNPECLAYLKVFLDAHDAQRHELVRRLTIVSIDDDPIQAIRNLLAPAIPPSLIDLICQAGIGMAKERADRCIRKSLPAIIDVDEFRKAFHAFVQKNNMQGYLSSVAPAPAASELQEVILGRPDFVKQLEFIEASDEQKLRAVSDLLLTSANKALWAENGLVFEGSFSEWERDLIRRHSAIEGEVTDLYSDKREVVRGRLVYNRCSALSLTLEGREVPGHFTHGGFNALADERILGWHPNYIELFKKES